MADSVSEIKSYNIDHTSFDRSFRALLKRATVDLVERPPRRDAVAEPTPSWSAYAKTVLNIVNSNSAVIEVFERRVRELFGYHSGELVRPVFNDDGSVNDQFLKSRDVFPGPSADPSIPGVPIRAPLEGPVVFFSDDATTSTACLAIGEIYRACIAEHLAATESNVQRRLLPTLTLLDWCSLVYHSVPEGSEHKDALAQNVIDLCDAAEKQAPGSGPGPLPAADVAEDPSTQAGMDGLMGMMSGLVSTFGGSHAGDINAAFGKFKDVLGALYKEVKAIEPAPGGQPPSVPDIISKLGDVLKTPDIQRQIEGFSADATSILGALGVMPQTTAGQSALTKH